MPTPASDIGQPFLDWYILPEAFSASLLSEFTQRFGLSTRSDPAILDPFVGSGTTLVWAKLHDVNAIGIEINPFLCFAARMTSCWEYDVAALREDMENLLRRLRPHIEGVATDGGLFKMPVTNSPSPQVSLHPPNMPRLSKWISPRVVDKVLAIKQAVAELPEPTHRDFALFALACILREASNMKLTPHAFGSSEHKPDAPVWDLYASKIRKMLSDIEYVAQTHDRAEVMVVEGDARNADRVLHNCPLAPFDMAITSPPYLNNLDYTMQTRLELFFLDYVDALDQLRSIRKQMVVCDAKGVYKESNDGVLLEHIGAARILEIADQLKDRLADRQWGWNYPAMVTEYFGGMYRVLCAVRKLLRKGAPFVIIVGESAHMGVHVPVPSLLYDLAHLAEFERESIDVLRSRRCTSHDYELAECAVVVRA